MSTIRIFLVVFLCISGFCSARNEIVFPQILLWGINNDNIESFIVPGEAIVDAKLTLQGMSFRGGGEDDVVYINLIHNPDASYNISVDDDNVYKPPMPPTVVDVNEIIKTLTPIFTQEEIQKLIDSIGKPVLVDPNADPNAVIFSTRKIRNGPVENAGTRLMEYRNSKTVRSSDLIITFSGIDDRNSHLYSVFSYPTKITLSGGESVTLTSSVLELMDYCGTGRAFGFLFVPKGNAKFSVNRIIFEITVRSYTGDPVTKTKRFLTNKAPIIIL